LGWSLRAGNCAAQNLPDNHEEVLLEAYLQEAWVIRNHKIPAALRVNTDQTQTVYAPGTKLTWNKAGKKQINIVGMDNKRAFTLVSLISASGEVLPMQAIYAGRTEASCPKKSSASYNESQELKFSFEPSGNDTYWSTMDTMKSLITNVIAPYFEAKKKELGISDPEYQSSLWKIDCWSLHKSKEFLGWMKKTHPNIIIIFVPGNCT
ncbi:hypothetical protein BT96DRAFT_757502, partial [Gymnopus androsaceus JB14]